MKNITHNPILVYLLILFSACTLIFFTWNQYSALQENQDAQVSLSQELEEKEDLLQKLWTLKIKLESEDSTLLDEISFLAEGYTDAEMIEYIYSYAQKVNLGNERVIIKNMSFTDSGESDVWFNTLSLKLSGVFSSEATLFAFLDFMSSTEGKYSFQVSNFYYPAQESGNITTNIPFTLYYK